MKNEFRIFPDIRLICDDMPTTGSNDIFEVSCCLRGVCEYRTESGYIYLSKGSCMIMKQGLYSECVTARSANCHTVTLIIESRSHNSMTNELIGISDFLHQLRNNKAYIFQHEKITEILSELYNGCVNDQTSVMKIKTLELFMLLNEYRFKYSSRDEKIKIVGEFICKHLSEHYTISQLSEMFEIDGTTLKNLFKKVHGCPVYNYAKNRKMFRAAELLRTADMKVIDISEEVGYSNASKFSSAFRDVMGVNPKYYQMEHNLFRKKTNDSILQNSAY